MEFSLELDSGVGAGAVGVDVGVGGGFSFGDSEFTTVQKIEFLPREYR